MAVFAYTYLPIFEVLSNGGRMSLSGLVDKLTSKYPQRFRDLRSVEWAIDTYVACLENDGAFVEYNRSALNYARVGILEGDIQSFLHQGIADMEDWQLYPFSPEAEASNS